MLLLMGDDGSMRVTCGDAGVIIYGVLEDDGGGDYSVHPTNAIVNDYLHSLPAFLSIFFLFFIPVSYDLHCL